MQDLNLNLYNGLRLNIALQDSSMEKETTLELIDSTNNDSDSENTGKLEDPDEELNVHLLVDVTEATQDDKNGSNTDVTLQSNGETDKVTSGVLKNIFLEKSAPILIWCTICRSRAFPRSKT